MASNIDPTKPVDDVPAEKADLRNNLAAAKNEIESMQLAVGSVLDYIPTSHHAAILAGSSTYDATSDIQDALDAIDGTVVFPPGLYRNSGFVYPKAGQKISGYGATLKLVDGLDAAGGATQNQGQVFIKNLASGVTIEGLTIDGNHPEVANKGGLGVIEGSGMFGVKVMGTPSVALRDMIVRNCCADCLMLTDNNVDYFGGDYEHGVDDPSLNFRVLGFLAENVVFSGGYRNSVTIGDGDNLRFVGCTFSDAGGQAPQVGVDIERDNAYQASNGVQFVNCRFTGNAQEPFMIAGTFGTTRGVLLDGCRFDDNGLYVGVYVNDAAAVVDDVRIQNCWIEKPSGSSNSLYVYLEGGHTMGTVIIEHNHLGAGFLKVGNGGGVGDGTVEHCIIRGNTFDEANVGIYFAHVLGELVVTEHRRVQPSSVLYAGAVLIEDALVKVRDSFLAAAEDGGAAVDVESLGSARLDHVDFVNGYTAIRLRSGAVALHTEHCRFESLANANLVNDAGISPTFHGNVIVDGSTTGLA